LLSLTKNNNHRLNYLKSTTTLIICYLYYSDSYVEKLAEQLDLTPGTVSFHLKKLEKAGIVICSRTQYYMIYSLEKEQLNKTILELTGKESSKLNTNDTYREKVIASFFKRGRLTLIPVQQKKREIVLSVIIKDLTVGSSYSEKEVNDVMARVYDDPCTLRRQLIEDGFMKRNNGVYTVIKK
jgi:ArsR family transcriptional regulator